MLLEIEKTLVEGAGAFEHLLPDSPQPGSASTRRNR